MLTAVALKNSKPASKPYKLADGQGMYLLVTPSGSRYWRLKYRVAGREKVLALGVFPDVPLAEARERREEARRMLRDGKDPSAQKQAAKRARKQAAGTTFRAIAQEWLKKQRNVWDPGHADQVETSLENNVFPDLGDKPIAEIGAPELLAVLHKIEARGAHEMRQRAQQRTSAVFRYGIAKGYCSRDPARDLRGAFTPVKVRHYAALGAKDLPAFLKKLAAYDGEFEGEKVTRLALQLLLLTFVRTGELRAADWSEFDLDAAEWRIPAERMKMREPHIVPLSKQALAVLKQLKELTGDGDLVFPQARKPEQPMSENTILYALYRMGYRSRATGHGFRSTASTILNELGFPPDVIERQLAHMERNKVRAAYNRAQYLPERRRMMQAWADLLDQYAAQDRKVVAGRFGART